MDSNRITPLTILAVLSIFFVCILVSAVISLSILGMPDPNGTYEYYPLIISQAISSILSFGLPAIIVAAWKSKSAFSTLTDVKPVQPLAWILAIAILTVCQPLVQWGAYVNEQICMNLDSWEGLRAMAMANNKLYAGIMHYETPLQCCLMIFLMAILPAIVEEMFFRGTMQRIMTITTRNPWMAIFTTSVVFSLLHGDMVAFFPRFILGFLLGIIYYFGHNIWVNIAAHAFNNLLAVTTLIYSEGDLLESLNKLQDNPGPVMPIIALALTILGIQGYIYRTQGNLPTNNNANTDITQ